MRRTLKIALAVVLALVLGIFIVVEAVLIIPNQFDLLYLGELSDKYERLRSLEDETKIIIIGGSSVAFGVSSELMEEYLDIPVVNFGLYGPLGTPVMMDLTRGHITEGDIIVLAPEPDEQTMSMDFNAEAMWECCDSNLPMLFKIRTRSWGDMTGSFWPYALKKFQFYISGKAQPEGIYSHDSFNDYGDIIYSREKSIMEDGYNPDVLVDLDTSIIESEFIDYVNEYVAYCESKGATVYWSWAPMDELAIVQDEEGILEYATFIRENFDCRLISDISDYIMDPDYFYDTNYHMTNEGTIVHTATLLQDLVNIIGDGSLVSIDQMETLAAYTGTAEEIEEDNIAPSTEQNDSNSDMEEGDNDLDSEELEVPDDGVNGASTSWDEELIPEAEGTSEDAAYFLYEPYNEGLMITGVTEEGKQQETLVVPWLIDEEKVIAIGSNAFDGCDNLQSIYIQSNISRIMQNAFDGCPKLQEIHVDNDSGSNILIPGSGLFDNVPNRVIVYVPQEYYGYFLADYFWGNYIDRIVGE